MHIIITFLKLILSLISYRVWTNLWSIWLILGYRRVWNTLKLLIWLLLRNWIYGTTYYRLWGILICSNKSALLSRINYLRYNTWISIQTKTWLLLFYSLSIIIRSRWSYRLLCNLNRLLYCFPSLIKCCKRRRSIVSTKYLILIFYRWS